VRILCVEVSQLRKSLRGSEHLPGVCDLSISLMGVDSMDVGGGSLCAKLQGGRNSRGEFKWARGSAGGWTTCTVRSLD